MVESLGSPAGTIHVRWTVIDADQAFQKRQRAHKQTCALACIARREVRQGGRGGQTPTSSKVRSAVFATRTGLEQWDLRLGSNGLFPDQRCVETNHE